MGVKKVDKFLGMVLSWKEEIHTIGNLLNFDSLWLDILLQHKLLKVQESFFILYFLPDLNLGFPSMGGEKFLTVITLGIDFIELNFEGLL